MGKIVINLTQHTPLLHFQPRQDHSTLRASEVKPRLDRYLKKYLGVIPIYKLHIKSVNDVQCLPIEKPIIKNGQPQFDSNGRPRMRYYSPMYFGNMGEDISSHKDYRLSKDCEMTIVYKDDDVSFFEKAKPLIMSFFRMCNFGARQSKGYGSFTVSIPGVNQTDPPGTYYFSLAGDLSWYDVMSRIELFYKTLRSGINGPDDNSLYFKSMMFQYAKYKKSQWDKKSIKQVFLNRAESKVQSIKHGHKEPFSYSTGEIRKDFRDYLGFSGSSPEMWRVDSGRTRYNERKNINEPVFNSFTIAKLFHSGGNELSRFRSPITFKPVKENNIWKVLILLSEIPNTLAQAEVIITSERRQPRQLRMSMAPEFSLSDFLKFVYDHRKQVTSFFDNKDCTPENISRYNQIVEMYNNLKVQQ